ncbi:MAG: hypothetical protein QOF64_2967 [Candidatus Binatota bacterium]|jgi:hypothetical protein|nr:hypothetical protein [Candidatus Binatota bacterium]
MISAEQCRAYSAQCALLGRASDISAQRATILLAMSRTWVALANQKDRYDAMVASESR